MRIKSTLFILLVVTVFSLQAQLHLGKSKDDLIARLGDNYVSVFDGSGNEVIAYINEIKDHPKFGNYTLYSLYVMENKLCIMQQSVMPVSQKEEIMAGFNSLYEKIGDLVWKSKEGIYYLLSFDRESLRMKLMSDSVYSRYSH